MRRIEIEVPNPRRAQINAVTQIEVNLRLHAYHFRGWASRTIPCEGMLIGDDRTHNSPVPGCHANHGRAGLPFSIALVCVVRNRQYDERTSADRELGHLMESQIVDCRVPKSRLSACGEKRIGIDGLVDAEQIVNAKDLERHVESKQRLISRSALIPLRRRREKILHYYLSL